MEEKKHCKWYNDEFCTNDKSPCVADYCPVVEYPELCKFREVAEDINVPNKDEKTIEFDDDVVDLFVEFDEMGFAPTTTCPDPEEYAKRWKKSLLDLIHRLQSEHKTLKTELRKECEEHEEFTKKAKAEIERLHKVIDEKFVSLKAVKAAGNSPKAMKMLVESVGCVQKDTAKEIYEEINEFSFCIVNANKDYEKGYFDAIADYKENIKNLFSKEEYGLEAE